MKKYIIPIVVVAILSTMTACDLYPDWEDYVEYSSVFPVAGEYYVRDYADDDTSDFYLLHIYNKSFNPTKDSIWIDNMAHPTGSGYVYKYKIKCKTDTVNLKFDCVEAGNITGTDINPRDSATLVTIVSSKIHREENKNVTDATADSIYFEITYKYYNDAEVLLTKTFITAGHRKTGWEDPNYDDDM